MDSFRSGESEHSYKQGLQKGIQLLYAPIFRQFSLLLCIVFFVLASLFGAGKQSDAYAAYPGQGRTCVWHRVTYGDTLGNLAWSYRTSVNNLAGVNNIANVNLIYVGQQLCISIPQGAVATIGRSFAVNYATVRPNGAVSWYAYDALGSSTQGQILVLLRQAAARYNLPANLLLAIAWQESGWRQHVISHDGGIGVMQIMPYTAMGLNRQAGVTYNPYQLWDNIELGALYLHDLWVGFHGNLVKIISAYNEGGVNVIRRGIFNWGYVNNVLGLMQRYR
ncbi:LysM peptidoglycan-binding domain-containing protein [Tengunoibacter tsumagoiensis]|uniref:LysM domain-containing protein n=1 Tax=Tengunoibacter tsumagoiensis TaxID=2014871 RepID=A0A401ZZF7_9CHLR|nr:transglycosylase SLT domain-containing protein [Tengunoibacter tsumagoiensis]GCE12250.1 hypothetical protein KTT_21090 [Tengunoibacter tsumagoiensis]